MVDLTKQFGKLYDDNIEKIYRFIFLKVESKEAAQDLSSQVFAKGWAKFKTGQDIKNPTAYLYQIARTEIVNHLRERTRIQITSIENIQVADEAQNLPQKQIFDAEMKQVKNALDRLDEDEQSVLIMKYLDDLPFKTIALALEKSEGAVRVMAHRALKKLKEEMGERRQ